MQQNLAPDGRDQFGSRGPPLGVTYWSQENPVPPPCPWSGLRRAVHRGDRGHLEAPNATVVSDKAPACRPWHAVHYCRLQGPGRCVLPHHQRLWAVGCATQGPGLFNLRGSLRAYGAVFTMFVPLHFHFASLRASNATGSPFDNVGYPDRTVGSMMSE